MAQSLGIVLIVLFLCNVLSAGKKIKPKDLPPKHQRFLKLTQYIITEEEKDVFMQLNSERERDIFIESFWKQRDPTPGTPENEYREKIIERFNHANKYLGRETVREGWKTDRGRIYIILGPPQSKERFIGKKGIYPTVVWYYYGEDRKKLPPQFALVFYQRGGGGEFQLYDPAVDGPSSLLIKSKNMDPFNYRKLYKKIKEIAPTLAQPSISLVQGEMPINFTPSPRNSILIKDILESPTEDVNPTYATHFMDYKGMVSTEYMTNFVESDNHTALLRDPFTGLNFLHFSVAPKNLSIDYYEAKDQYYCNFVLDVSLRKGEKVIFQYSKKFPYYFPAQEIERIRSNGLAIEDSFPVAQGNYKLIILLRNSVGKEFTVIEKNINIPETSDSPHIVGPLVGYNLRNYKGEMHIPYKVLERKLVVDPKNTFASGDDISLMLVLSEIDRELWEEGKVNIRIKGTQQKSSEEKSYKVSLDDQPFRKILALTHTFPAKELRPDYYEFRITLQGEKGKILDESKGNFIVSPQESISHPIAHTKGFPLSHSYTFYYMLARQYNKANKNEKASFYYQKAFQMNPDYKEGLIDYVNFLLKTEKYNKGLELIERIKGEERFQFDYFFTKGRLYMKKGNYHQAIKHFQEGNKIYNSNISLLNSLGYCYSQVGEKDKALEILKASLSLNKEQPSVQKWITKLEKKDR